MKTSVLLEKAIQIAVNAHFGQRDKADQPYIFHPLAVMNMCATWDEKTVAILHDVVEDTPVTLDDLSKEFPPHIVNAVDALTRRIYANGEKETYRDFIQRCGDNPLARKVKVYDLTHNLSEERVNNLQASERVSMCKKYKKALVDLEHCTA